MESKTQSLFSFKVNCLLFITVIFNNFPCVYSSSKDSSSTKKSFKTSAASPIFENVSPEYILANKFYCPNIWPFVNETGEICDKIRKCDTASKFPCRIMKGTVFDPRIHGPFNSIIMGSDEPTKTAIQGTNKCENISYEGSQGVFQCKNGRCIPRIWLYDLEDDCGDGSDEKIIWFRDNLSFCHEKYISGRLSGVCRTKIALCNGDRDCGDGPDEYSCLYNCLHLSINPISACDHYQFSCGDSCIPLSWQCDGIVDCKYGFDEFMCSTNNQTIKTSNKDDINAEISAFNKDKLDFIMIGQNFIYSKLDPSLGGESYYENVNSTFKGVDYALRSNYLIWSSSFENGQQYYIRKLNKNHESFAQENPTLLLSGGRWHRKTKRGYAIDWIHNLLYFVTDDGRSIEVAQIENPINRAIIVEVEAGYVVSNIAIDPIKGFLIYAVVHLSNRKMAIERVFQDGSDRQRLTGPSDTWIHCLTLDIVKERIYWLDYKHKTLNTITYDGSRFISLTDLPISNQIRNVVSIDLLGDILYYEVSPNFLYSQQINLKNETLGKFQFIIHERSYEIPTFAYFSIVDPRKQPFNENKCEDAKCEHICLPSSSTERSHQCKCRNGFKLRSTPFFNRQICSNKF